MKAAEKAAEYYAGKYNCAQATALAAAEALDIELPDAVIRGLKSFSGGLGFSGCVCGALAGAEMIIGIVEDKPAPKAAALHNRFKEEYKSTCCRVLSRNLTRGTPEQKARCGGIVETTTRLLLEELDFRVSE